jgi:hypothetical protein
MAVTASPGGRSGITIDIVIAVEFHCLTSVHRLCNAAQTKRSADDCSERHSTCEISAWKSGPTRGTPNEWDPLDKIRLRSD